MSMDFETAGSATPAAPAYITEKVLFAEFLKRDLVFCDGFGRERSRVNAQEYFVGYARGENEDIGDAFKAILDWIETSELPSSNLEDVENALINVLDITRRMRVTFDDMKRDRALSFGWENDDPRWDAMPDEVYSPAPDPITEAEAKFDPWSELPTSGHGFIAMTDEDRERIARGQEDAA